MYSPLDKYQIIQYPSVFSVCLECCHTAPFQFTFPVCFFTYILKKAVNNATVHIRAGLHEMLDVDSEYIFYQSVDQINRMKKGAIHFKYISIQVFGVTA